MYPVWSSSEDIGLVGLSEVSRGLVARSLSEVNKGLDGLLEVIRGLEGLSLYLSDSKGLDGLSL